MKALVTGACGFVGAYLIKHLLQCGDTVCGTFLGDIVEKVPGCQYEKLDILNFEECSKVIGGFEPEVIYHLAGIAFVPEAEKNFDATMSINVTGVHNVLRIPHLLQRKTTVIFVSSGEVYGKVPPEAMPLSESRTIRPHNAYSLSKAFAEMVAQSYGDGQYIKAIIVRPFNHIGPGQNNRFVASNFAWQLARIKKGLQPPVIMVGNLEAQRDFSDVQDIVRGYRLAAEKGNGTYNLGSGKAVTIQEVLDTLIKVSGLTIKVEQDQARMRAAEVPLICSDISKAKKELGWEPRETLEESLARMFEYWSARA